MILCSLNSTGNFHCVIFFADNVIFFTYGQFNFETPMLLERQVLLGESKEARPSGQNGEEWLATLNRDHFLTLEMSGRRPWMA
ncbi:hypothetical protein A9199_12230 [Donghicola sp. JL3646]|nr:hypothetical protein BSK21_15650 [Marivivens sp. JLT3646]OBR39234.1 hypothetical protein A9199_12230 [Donghicola sp. JL3646]